MPEPLKEVGLLIRNVWPLIGLVFVLGACNGGEVVDDTSTSPSTATTVRISTTTSPPPVATSTTTTPGPSFEPGELPFPAEWVVASDRGVSLVSTGGSVVQLWDQAAAVAFMVGDNLVAAQGSIGLDSYPRLADGPIVVFDSTGSWSLPMEAERLVLFDAGVVNDQPVVVATSRTGDTPDDTDERLLLIDLITGERTDLGSVGDWESGVVQARLYQGGVVMLTDIEGQQQAAMRSLTGTDEWTVRLGSETSRALTISEDQLVLLQPGFTEPDFTPTITMDRYTLQDGSSLGTTTIILQPVDQVRIEGGFCFTAEWVGEALVCDQTYGGPLRVNTSGTVEMLGDFDQGVVTVPRVGT